MNTETGESSEDTQRDLIPRSMPPPDGETGVSRPATSNASRICLVEPLTGERMTYRTLVDRVHAWRPSGNPHEIAFKNVGDYLTEFLGCVLRDIPLILPPALSVSRMGDERREIGAAPERSSPEGFFDLRSETLADLLRMSGAARVILSTSGSTGRPKRVTQTLATLMRAVRSGPAHEQAVWGLAYHLCHMAGVQVLLQALINGNTLVNLNGLRPNEVLAVMRAHSVTHISATPTFYRLLPRAVVPLNGVKRVTFGGEAFDPSLKRRMETVFPTARFLNVFALTEAGTLFAAREDWFIIPPAMAGRVQIVDGELQIHHSLTGEWSGEKNSENVSPWYCSGDLVQPVPGNGDDFRFRYLRRKGREINIGGFEVNHLDVEAVLREHDAVSDGRVYARPSSVLGSILCCDAVLSRAIEERELRSFLAERLHPYQIPRVWHFVDAPETTPTGKLAFLENAQ